MNKLTQILIRLCLITILSTIGCRGEEPQQKTTVENLMFSTVDSLLSQRTVDSVLSISYRPPKGWERVSRQTVDMAMKKVSRKLQLASKPGTNIRNVFQDRLSGATAVLSKMSAFDLSDTTALLQSTSQYFKSKDSAAVVRSATFRYGPFSVFQVMVVSNPNVILKMLFKPRDAASPAFEWEFDVPQMLYPDKARTIESVVGSLQIHKTIH